MRNHHDLHLDFETYCGADLSKVGAWLYTTHPTFKVLCVAWKLDERAIERAVIAGQALPPALQHALESPDVQGHAWNASFETAVLRRLGVTPANPLSCTQQRALSYGLPAKLETAGKALGLVRTKDLPGHRLMLKMSKPLKPGAAPWTDADYRRLADYCVRDVEVEAAIAPTIPELQPEEQELAALDSLMNSNGELGIDFDRVLALQRAAKAAERADAARCAGITDGAVTSPRTQTARLLAWLAARQFALPDTQRATIEAALAGLDETEHPDIAEVLQIRLRAARTSTAKLARMLDTCSLKDWSLRHQFQFCGAGRTGRWSGRGIQLQNLPRVPKGFSPDLFVQMAKAADARLDAVAPAPVLDCVSWSLRSCLKATSDKQILWSFDFAQIEARTLAWLAGQSDVLAVFASGEDIYSWAAREFGSDNRQLGKVLVLALGFGMGAVRLRETAQKAYGVAMTAREAERFKSGWRQRNQRIVQFWAEMEFAARNAILNPGRVYPVAGSGVAFTCTPRTLQLRLPSGRVLYYHRPSLSLDDGSISYWGPEVGGQWVPQRTWGGKLAENATQACARDVMSEAMLRAWRRHGLAPCMSIHDELVFAIAPDKARQSATNSDMRELMLEPPPWAGGLPLAGESKIMARYGVASATRHS